MSDTLKIEPIEPSRLPAFAGSVSGVDLREPPDAPLIARLEAAMDRYAVLVFRDQYIDDAQQQAFVGAFGPIEALAVTVRGDQPKRTALVDISNLDENNRRLAVDDRRRMFNLANRLWHSDSSFRVVPGRYSALSARRTPTQGGNTEFADMRAAWDALDTAARAEVRGLTCAHSLLYSRAQLGVDDLSAEERARFEPVRHPLVRRHPVTGRESLFLSAHAGRIDGLTTPDALMLLRDLTEHATQPAFVHSHAWRDGDLVMWDNRVTMHRGRRFDETQVRDLRRVTTQDLDTTELAAEA